MKVNRLLFTFCNFIFFYFLKKKIEKKKKMNLQTKRLEFQKWEEEDCEFLLKHYSNQKVLKFMEECVLNNLEEATNLLREFNEDYSKHSFSQLKVIEKESGKLIGVAGCWEIKTDENGSRIEDDKEGNIELEIGYDLDPNFWGKG